MDRKDCINIYFKKSNRKRFLTILIFINVIANLGVSINQSLLIQKELPTLDSLVDGVMNMYVYA